MGPCVASFLWPTTRSSWEVILGTWTGQSVPGLVRLNHDGSLDPSFKPRLSFQGLPRIRSLWPHVNGTVLVSGDFISVDSKPRPYFARLLPDGSNDPTFAGFVDGEINDVCITAGDALYIVGMFKTVNGLVLPGIARLLANGQVDASFQPSFEATGTALAVATLDHGDVLVAGLTIQAAEPTLFGLIRLDADSQLNEAYYLGTPSFFARRLLALSNGGLILQSTFAVDRLLSDGGLDERFDLTELGPFAPDLVQPLPDGRLLAVGGSLTGADGKPARLVRLFSDGKLDGSFQANLDFVPDCFGIAADDTVYAGGVFYGQSGGEGRIVRLSRPEQSAPPVLLWSGTELGVPASARAAQINLIRDGELSDTSSVIVSMRADEADGFVPTETVVEFAAGEAFKSISIPAPALASSTNEILVHAELSAPVEAALGSNRVVTVHFVPGQGTIDLATSALVLGEPQGASGIQIRRWGAAAYPVRATWNIESDLSDPAKFFSRAQGSILFEPGQTNGYANFNVLDNTSVDGNQSFRFVIRSLSAGFTLGASKQSTITVTENDQPGFPGDGIDGRVSEFLEQPDGKVLVLGSFHTVHGRPRERLARLLPDGSLDELFAPKLEFPSTAGAQEHLALAPDGGIFISGTFTNVNGLPKQYPDASESRWHIRCTF